MVIRGPLLLLIAGLTLVVCATPARAQDVAICLRTADHVVEGQTVGEEEKRLGHEACLRALSDTSSIVQKYKLQEADFDIMGTRPKP